MSDLPPPTPAGELIRRVREMAVPKPSRPDVAHRAGIDPGTLGNIERGYRHLGNRQVREVPGEAHVIAKVARVLLISPERLESEGQRPDAAEILREMLRPAAGPAPPSFPEPPTAAEEARERFPDDQVAQAIWRLPNTTEAEKWEMIATLERKRREIHARKSQAS